MSDPKIVRRLSDLPRVRTTSLEVFEACPYEWAMQYLSDGPPEPDGKKGAAAIGTAVHTIAEHTNHAMGAAVGAGFGGRPAPPEKDVELAWATVPPAEVPAAQEYLRAEAELAVEGWTPFALEQDWELPWPGSPEAPPLGGHIDVARYHAALKTLMLEDHKTERQYNGVDYWRARLQPQLYAWAARRLWVSLPGVEAGVRFRIGLVNAGGPVEWDITPDSEPLLEARLQRIWRRMRECEDAGKWPREVHDKCGWCPVRDECPEVRGTIVSLRESLEAKVGQKTLGEKREWLRGIKKTVEAMLADVDAALKEAVEAAGGSLRQGPLWYRLEKDKKRVARFVDTWARLHAAMQELPPAEAVAVAAMLDSVFTVKVTGLDEVARASPLLKPVVESCTSIKEAVEASLVSSAAKEAIVG